MLAISLHQPFASWIAEGKKTLEIRARNLRYRGPLLICSCKRPKSTAYPCGYTIAIAQVIDARPMLREDAHLACTEYVPGKFAWTLAGVREVPPMPVTGAQGFFHVSDRKLRDFGVLPRSRKSRSV